MTHDADDYSSISGEQKITNTETETERQTQTSIPTGTRTVRTNQNNVNLTIFEILHISPCTNTKHLASHKRPLVLWQPADNQHNLLKVPFCVTVRWLLVYANKWFDSIWNNSLIQWPQTIGKTTHVAVMNRWYLMMNCRSLLKSEWLALSTAINRQQHAYDRLRQIIILRLKLGFHPRPKTSKVQILF